MARRRGASHRGFGSPTDRRMKLVRSENSWGLSPPADMESFDARVSQHLGGLGRRPAQSARPRP